MSTLTIEERILVSAPPKRVWAFLLDPARVAPCLPGAKLDGVEGKDTFLGTMKVKVGPVTMEFKGKATMTEIHEAERRVVLTGTGADKGGSGSAKMSMESRILDAADGGSEIIVIANVDLAGKLVGFGRGMMGGISKQMFKQFAERVRAHLAEEEDEEDEEVDAAAAPLEAAATPAEPTPVAETLAAEAPSAIEVKPAVEEEPAAAEPAATKEAPAASGEPTAEKADEAPGIEATNAAAAPTAEAPKSEASTAVDEADAGAAAPAKVEATASKSASPTESPPEPAKTNVDAPAAPRKKKKKASTAIVPEDNAPLSAGSLVFAAFWEWLKGLFRRLFGGRPPPR